MSKIKPIVEIITSGRGGSIHYSEGDNKITFDWEFAMPPALALIFGTTAQHWKANYPWATGRQAKIYNFVAGEVVRQKAPGSEFNIDLDTGTLTVKMALYVKRSPARTRSKASMVPKPRGSEAYDVAEIPRMTTRERKQLVDLLTHRGEMTPRDVEALAAIKTKEARAAVDEASKDHLSIDTRLAAAEVMHQQGRMPDLDTFLARQIRLLSQPANGLKRALDLAARHPSETVMQALLRASYNTTECAPHCAGLLLTLKGVGKEPFDEKLKPMLQKLGLHNSYFDRKAAFEDLCLLVKMKFDPSAGN